MDTQDRAAEVIRTWQKRHKNIMDENPDWAAQNLAGDLEQEGLFTSDLPEPSYVVTECGQEYPVWEALTGFSIGADLHNKEFYVLNDYEPDEPLSRARFRTMLLYMQAAETYMGKNE